jgi:hypothetical protein
MLPPNLGIQSVFFPSGFKNIMPISRCSGRCKETSKRPKSCTEIVTYFGVQQYYGCMFLLFDISEDITVSILSLENIFGSFFPKYEQFSDLI